LEDFSKTLGDLEHLINDRGALPDENEHLHCAWICILEDGRRVEPAEINLVAMLVKHMPVVIVITKARADGGFRAVVQQMIPQASNVIRVRALEETLDDGHVSPPQGLKELVDWTMMLFRGTKKCFRRSSKSRVAV